MINLEGINKTFNKGNSNENKVLNNLNLSIGKGEIAALMGRSGAGKSTLLHIISCLDSADEGKYILDGHDITNYNDKKQSKLRNKKIGVLLQNFALLDSQTAISNVITPLFFSKVPFSSMKRLAMESIEKVGLGKLAYQKVCTMSGGEKQRIALARAMVNNPNIIIADEPTGSLDSKTADDIMSLFKIVNKSGTTFLIVTHDKIIADKCDRVLELKNGMIL